MPVSFEKAVDEVLSDKFNKVNIAVFTFITAVLGSVQLIFQPQLQNRSNSPEYAQAVFICFIAALCAAVISAGYGALAAHRGAQGKSEIFPSASEMGSIILTGIKSLCGSFILAVLVFIPFIIIIVSSAVFYGAFIRSSGILTSVLLFCIGFAFCIAWLLFSLFKFFIPLYLMFVDTLQFSAFFAFSRIKSFLEARKGHY